MPINRMNQEGYRQREDISSAPSQAAHAHQSRPRPAMQEAEARMHERGSPSYDRFLPILSEHSADSLWVSREVDIATKRERGEETKIFSPIRLDETDKNSEQDWVKDIRSTQRHIEDFTKQRQPDAYLNALGKILSALKRSSAARGSTIANIAGE